jgi:L,D-transpeptidase ErfK/SrfK
MRFGSAQLKTYLSSITLVAALTGGPVLGATYLLPPEGVDVIGEIQYVAARYEDTLPDIAREHGLGFDEIILANPDVDPWLPGEGTQVVLPTRFILPDAPRKGIVLNVAEMRLYYFPTPRAGEIPVVITYPVSIGRMDWKTPLGRTQVVQKIKDPSWSPPESIRREHAADGEILPSVVPPGPDNPLGQHALRLGIRGYLIHGTNKPVGVGMRVTHGCVRMYPENIASLFEQVRTGTPVYIVNQPIKVGWYADTLFMEVHPLLEEDRGKEYETAATVLAEHAWLLDYQLSSDRLGRMLEHPTGIPTPLTQL